MEEAPCECQSKEIIQLIKEQGGLGWSSLKHLTEKLRLIKRNSMMHSKDSDIKQLLSETEYRNIESDALLAAQPSIRCATRNLSNNQQEEAWIHLNSLKIQGASVATINSEIDKKEIKLWSSTVEKCSNTIANFAHKALLQTLPTSSNLVRWKKNY